MLVLSRAVNEKIIITLPNGDLLKITIVELRRGKVRLGIEAPREIPVHREEVYNAINREAD